MAARACHARLRKEVRAFEPPPYIRASPLETNLQEWRFVLQGPPDSPYEGGMYQGKVKFPDEYPFKPPSIYMLTPNGRFETDRRLCLSISDFHPESWVPTWSVASILNGVLSFMLESAPTTGAVETSLAEKHKLRDRSVAFNAGDKIFCELFPELVDGKPFTTDGAKPAPPPETTTAATTATEPAPSQKTAETVGGAAAGSSDGAAAVAEEEVEEAGSGGAETDTAEAVVDGESDAARAKKAAANKKKREKAAAKKREAAAAAVGGAGGAAAGGAAAMLADPLAPEEDEDDDLAAALAVLTAAGTTGASGSGAAPPELH